MKKTILFSLVMIAAMGFFCNTALAAKYVGSRGTPGGGPQDCQQIWESTDANGNTVTTYVNGTWGTGEFSVSGQPDTYSRLCVASFIAGKRDSVTRDPAMILVQNLITTIHSFILSHSPKTASSQ